MLTDSLCVPDAAVSLSFTAACETGGDVGEVVKWAALAVPSGGSVRVGAGGVKVRSASLSSSPPGASVSLLRTAASVAF